MNFRQQEINRQIENRRKLLEGIRPLESALYESYSLTLGLGINVQKNYQRLLRASVDLVASLERISMESKSVHSRVYTERMIENYHPN